jgi:hypothetical protein
MPPHPNHPCSRCGRQFGKDEVMWMTVVYQPRFRNRVRTAPACLTCLDDGEREIAAGITYVPCYGRSRPMAPLVKSLDVRQGMSGVGREKAQASEAAAADATV